jgi:hypothetical protein
MIVTQFSPTAKRREQIRSELWNVIPSTILILVMVWSVVQSVVTANWAVGTDIIVKVALPAVLVGAVFARLLWLQGWLAHLLSMALGLVWSIAALAPQLDARLVSWRDQASEVLIRAIIWSRVIMAGGRGEDILLFVTILALLSWILGYSSAWLILRRSWTWFAVFINGVVILVNYTFVMPKPTNLFFFFLGSALLLIVFQNIVQKQSIWRDNNIEFPEFLSLRFLSAATLFCSSMILVTSLLPNTISSEQVARAWKTMSSPLTEMRERWEDAFSTINSPPGTGGGGFATNGAQLGGTRVLADTPVMYVSSPSYDYWRAIASDFYSGHGWQNTLGEDTRSLLGESSIAAARTPLEPGIALPIEEAAGRQVITQTVELLQDRKDDFVMMGGQALTISLPTLIEHGFVLNGTNQLQPNFTDTSLIISQVPLRAGGVYSVTAMVSLVDERSLREAGTNYPSWIVERYLQLPDTVTERTRQLAAEIVRDEAADNPYDIAMAFQRYLRRLPYNQQIQMAPSGQDAVDYFLFDLREGYCDYFSSSMIVMLRSQGIPARWVQGYAGGVYDNERQAYLVRENVAHSWPEVYFPGYGWQRFEPTAASYTAPPLRPAEASDEGDFIIPIEDRRGVPLDLPDGSAYLPNDEDEWQRQQLEERLAASREAQAARERQAQVREWALIAGTIALLVGAVALFYYLKERQFKKLGPAAAAFARVQWLGAWAGWPVRPEHTAHEYIAQLHKALPDQREPLQRILQAYVTDQYRKRQTVTPAILEEDWKSVRLSFFKEMLKRLKPKPRQ